MACVWRKKTCSARDVVECLSREKEVAYNTVQTIMTRLVEKGLLGRTLKGKTHIYKPKQAKKMILRTIINQSMKGLMSQFGEEALVAFVDGIDDISDATRQKLIQKLQDR